MKKHSYLLSRCWKRFFGSLSKPSETTIIPEKSPVSEKLVFFHIMKTGGTSLHNILTDLMPPDLICPVRFNNLKMFDSGYLDQFAFFSGHYDWECVKKIPGRKKVFTLLREPKARILSLYHFWRSHTWSIIENDHLIGPRVAKSLNLECFLSVDDPAITPNFDNALARYLIGGVFVGQNQNFLCREDEIVDRAINNLKSMDAVGVLELPEFGISYLLNELALPVPDVIPRARDSIKFSEEPNMEFVERQPISEEAEDLLDKMTMYDSQIYQYFYKKYSETVR